MTTITDTVVPSAILIIAEPCVAIISICLPTMLPVLRDLASWSTIEYKKMMCRIKTALDGQNPPDSERILAPAVVEGRDTTTARVCKVRLASRQERVDGMVEISCGYEEGDEGVFPTKPVLIRGRVMSV